MVSVEGVSATALNIGVIVIVIVIVGAALIAMTLIILNWRKYQQFRCIIYEKDGFGQLREKVDMAGIFVDKKTQNKRFFLKKNKVGLDPDNIPYISTQKGKKIVYLLQTGLKNFRFLRFGIDTSTDDFKIGVGEEDVNWAINAYERQKKLFSQSLLMQLLPFMLVAFVSIIILVIFIYFFKNFATLKDMAQALTEMASHVENIKSGTTVITGGG